MVKKARSVAVDSSSVDVACVIHGRGYDWQYVEKLHHMVLANTRRSVRFHVWTEHDRPVPSSMIKHILEPWPGVEGPKKSWWYKMQLFDPEHVQARLLYFDLDTVIVRNIDWLWDLDPPFFWTIRDFRHLWKPAWQGLNSSLMLWDTVRFAHVWKDFRSRPLESVMRQFHGDQDYLNSVLARKDLRFVPGELVKSWRWQVKDGGMDMNTRSYRRPGAGSVLDPDTSVMVFHGHPKPHEIADPVIGTYWLNMVSNG